MAFATTKQGDQIYYSSTGSGPTALVFVHGWMGSGVWWDQQRDHFASDYTCVQLDLEGHGKSDKTRKARSVLAYAEDIAAVVEHARVKNAILIGHSMSGSNVVEAAALLPQVSGLILVDTLHNLDEMMTSEKAQSFLDMLRNNYDETIKNVLPNFLIVSS